MFGLRRLSKLLSFLSNQSLVGSCLLGCGQACMEPSYFRQRMVALTGQLRRLLMN